MNRLIALDMRPSDSFVSALFKAWDDGDAVLPVDQRLPIVARRSLLEAMGVAIVRDEQGTESTISNSRPIVSGDALVIATSGSTGQPKGVVHTHKSLAASARASNSRLGTTAADHWLACLPLSHIGGFAVITRARMAGCELSIHNSFDAQAVDSAARNGATMTSLVSTALARVDSSRFRKILLGAGPAPQGLPANIVKTYGMTETGSGVAYDGIALDGVEIRIGVDDEIFVRGEMLLRCYRDDHDPKDNSGWLPTNDIGSLIDGQLRVSGRRGDLIITGGENVWPLQVEAAIMENPKISEVCVRGVADEKWGQRVVAWLAPRNDETISLAEIRDWVKATLPAYCAPHEIRQVKVLPRTTIGKIDFLALP